MKKENDELLLNNLALEELRDLKKVDDSAKGGKSLKQRGREDKAVQKFLYDKKKEMQDTNARRRFDSLWREVQNSILDTSDKNSNDEVIGNNKFTFLYSQPTPTAAAQRFVQFNKPSSTKTTNVPQANEPMLLSKIYTATSLLGSNVPNADFMSEDKIYARANYELWRDSWLKEGGNGQNTLQMFYQDIFTCGWGAFRTFPRRIEQPVQDTSRILFDGIYRVRLTPDRTWLGVGFNQFDYWSQTEYLYEEDMPIADFMRFFPDAKKSSLEYCGTAPDSDEKDGTKALTMVTIKHYENILSNTYKVACGSFVIYNGPLVNKDGFGTVLTAQAWQRPDPRDPYGVGIYELGRGNERLANHLRMMNAEQVEAEIAPLLFGPNVGNGDMTYRRGAGIINPMPAGQKLEIVRTTGNVAQSMGLVNAEKNDMDSITGINDIVAGIGGESTVGATVIAAEAARNRLMPPRNSVINALQKDALICVSFQQQTLSVERILSMKSETLKLFTELNPNYFIREIEEVGDKKLIGVSKNVSLGFDWKDKEKEDDDVGEEFFLGELPEIEDRQSPVTLSGAALFEKLDGMKDKYNVSRDLRVKIDGSSMLMPSQEIQRQQINTLYPLLSEKVKEAVMIAQEDPVMGRVLITQLMEMLKVNNQNPYTWLPKDVVDAAMSGALANEDKMQLAMANRQAALQAQMAEVGMQQPTPTNNIQQLPNEMRDMVNSSMGKAAEIKQL